jgi:hypothetical protein
VAVTRVGTQPDTTTLAPADRVAGTRGPRAKLAGLAAVAALLPLAFSSVSTDPEWARFAFGVAAAALVGAALVLWIARRRSVVALGVALCVLGAAVAAYAQVERAERGRESDRWGGAVFRHEERGRILTGAQAGAVPEGITKAELTARLGVPAGSGVQRVLGDRDLRCLAYRTGKPERAGQRLHAFCFRDGRYAALRRW